MKKLVEKLVVVASCDTQRSQQRRPAATLSLILRKVFIFIMDEMLLFCSQFVVWSDFSCDSVFAYLFLRFPHPPLLLTS